MLEELNDLLANDRVSTDKETLQIYGKDWTKHINADPSAIVFPVSTKEVSALVKWARKHKVALVPSGGRTGLSGAAIATNKEVVVSFDKMNKIKQFNSIDQTLTCEAGVITEEVQNFAKEKGLYYPIDFAARGSSQIGGNIATNAGGIKVIRYGLTRNWVTSLTVVTGTGDILHLNNSLVKNASGYDLRHLMIGSEGTLGLITQATVKLTRPPKEPQVFILGVPELSKVMEIYKTYTHALPLLAFEMFTETALKYVLKHTDLQRPFESQSNYYVLIEIENDSNKTIDDATSLFETCFENNWVEDGCMSQSPQQAKEFWRLREDISEATSHYQPYKNDISVKVSDVPKFLTDMDRLLTNKYPDFDVVWFGHIGDGNLHINILKPENLASDEFMQQCSQVNDVLFDMIEKFNGSVSAEHGVGLTKKAYLHHTREPQDINYMKQIKTIFDPDHILNPGKIFD